MESLFTIYLPVISNSSKTGNFGYISFQFLQEDLRLQLKTVAVSYV